MCAQSAFFATAHATLRARESFRGAQSHPPKRSKSARNFCALKTLECRTLTSYGEVIDAYEYHPEAKCADATGQPCGKQTVGLLQRRHVKIGQLTNIGKESNSLEEVQAGIEHDEADVYTEYRDRRRSAWNTMIAPAVKKASLVVLERMCRGHLSRRALIDIRAGRSTPHVRNQQFLQQVVQRLGLL